MRDFQEVKELENAELKQQQKIHLILTNLIKKITLEQTLRAISQPLMILIRFQLEV